MWQKVPWKTEIIIALIVLPLVIGAVYLYKRSNVMPQDITYEHALPWSMLEDGYKALNGHTSFYGKTLEQLQEMEGEKIAVYGYMYPIKMADKHDHFLLSQQPHICQFHIPAHSGSMVEVIMNTEGILYNRRAVLLTGVFSIPNDKELGITFRLEEAELVDD